MFVGKAIDLIEVAVNENITAAEGRLAFGVASGSGMYLQVLQFHLKEGALINKNQAYQVANFIVGRLDDFLLNKAESITAMETIQLATFINTAQ